MVTLLDGDLYQWDTGRVVQIDPNSGYDIHEVHFATRKMDFAYVAKTYKENGLTYCKIPNILLQNYYDIYCYEVRENDDGEESTSVTVFKITKRNRPLDYIYTDPEKYTYKEIENRMKELEDALHDVQAVSEETAALANDAYTMAETSMTKTEEAYAMAESVKTKVDEAYELAESAKTKTEEAYAMAESVSNTVSNFDERISSIEENPPASNNVVEF